VLFLLAKPCSSRGWALALLSDITIQESPYPAIAGTLGADAVSIHPGLIIILVGPEQVPRSSISFPCCLKPSLLNAPSVQTKYLVADVFSESREVALSLARQRPTSTAHDSHARQSLLHGSPTTKPCPALPCPACPAGHFVNSKSACFLGLGRDRRASHFGRPTSSGYLSICLPSEMRRMPKGPKACSIK
jgi:hypothetical protein